ncbi:outer membrane protein transport protein [Paracoccus sp. 1_MG-2023]|uniref:OmpP1/FadL family transporter n=1 Tax=unclassified Paracoccus (in: a-proteobacteria) TaxID=2688777 RepID=UPI001C092CC2|nr:MULTISPECIES: outer membrane protein transport protein [unclassified Paracoccus (in: a-proteobacteria)]MBU2956648.1 outer membrane protein transport protein [Paracoccus sp. C2R09]MDO6668754.1 outer membrane protein transport protein [Paracoccus sp. 1_MG-2023]
MKIALTGAAALLMGASPMFAGGIERAPQTLSALFEEGNYVELSFGGVDPSVEGTDTLGFSTGDVAQGYGFTGLAYKHQFTEAFSGAIIVEQPFGADIRYPGLADGGSALLGGTFARVDSTTFTALGRYKMPNQFSVHGGIRGSRADGEVGLNGLAYGPVAGYNVDLDADTAIGWVAGVAWEKPEIAARVSLTYNSEIEHDFDTTETGPLVDPDGDAGPAPDLPLLAGDSVTTVKTPQSWNLEFQTGVAPDTLVFGSVRWVDWSEFRVDPANFVAVTGGGLVELEDSTTYTIGIGRKFNETWSGSASFTFEKAGDDLVSPLAPTNGRKGITLAAIYNQGPMRVTTGVNYTKLGDATPETGTPDTARAEMTDSHAWGVGVRVGYSF